MKGSRKQDPPQELLDWLALECDDWKPSYPFDDAKVRIAVVEILFREQRGLCVYCGRKLDMSSPGKSFHIEHFRPRQHRPDLSVEHGNLFLSCGQEDEHGNTSQTCGTRKGNWFDEEKCIEPIYAECTRRFQFRRTGDVRAANPSDDAATEMIAVLGLANPELKKEREMLLEQLDLGTLTLDDCWDINGQIAESLAHVAYQHLGEILP